MTDNSGSWNRSTIRRGRQKICVHKNSDTLKTRAQDASSHASERFNSRAFSSSSTLNFASGIDSGGETTFLPFTVALHISPNYSRLRPIVVDAKSISPGRTGPATGNVWIMLGQLAFPFQNWNDFVVVILEAWASAIVRMLRGVSEHERV